MGGKSLDKYYFDHAEADRVVKFFETFLHHVKGQYGPLILESWQKKILQDIFGWKMVGTGLRRYRRVFIFLPRKNAKTTLAAGIILYMLTVAKDQGAEIYSAAGDKEQAKRCFEVVTGMIGQSPRLRNVLAVWRNSVTLKGTGSYYKPLSADAYTKHGFNSYAIVFDELHVQPNRELWDVLTTSMGSRSEPLVVAITTAGFDRNSICYEQYDYACKVRDGVIIDEKYYPVIYEASEDDDPFSPETHKKANPGYGTIISADSIADEATRARNTPSYLNTFKRLHLNIWTSADQAWIPPHVWAMGNKGPIDITQYTGSQVYLGMDLAAKEDLVALVMIIPAHNIIKGWYWVTAEKVRDRKNKNEIDYSAWIKQGYITEVEGNAHDYPAIERQIMLICACFQVLKAGFDKWNSYEIAQRLLAAGVPMAPVEQTTYRLNEATTKIESLATQGQLSHGGDPVLSWMISNVTLIEDQEGRKRPAKRKSKDKIDGAVAMVIAAAEWVAAPQVIPDEPGVMVL